MKPHDAATDLVPGGGSMAGRLIARIARLEVHSAAWFHTLPDEALEQIAGSSAWNLSHVSDADLERLAHGEHPSAIFGGDWQRFLSRRSADPTG